MRRYWISGRWLDDLATASTTAAAAIILLTLFSGCAAHNPKSGMGWHPRSEQKMRILIGTTTMEALHQYQTHLRKQQEAFEELRRGPKSKV